MKNENLVIYCDVPVVVKMVLSGKRKSRKTPRQRVYNVYGDIPVAMYDSETKTLQGVVNTRRYGYALRNAFRNFKNKKKDFIKNLME